MTFHDLGIDAELERCYRALVHLPPSDLATVAFALGRSPADTEELLARLERLGLVRADPAAVTIIEPGAAIGTLIERIEDDLIARYRRVSATRSDIGDLRAAYAAAQGRSPDGDLPVDRIEDPVALRDKIEELSFFTRTSLRAMQPGGPSSAESLEAARPLDRRGLRRGIDMRIIHERSVVEDATHRAYLTELALQGAQVRITDQPAHRMLIMDDEVAVVPVDPDNPARGALIVRQPVLLGGFQDLFDRTWNAAVDLKDIDDQPAPDGAELPELDRSVLALMRAGVTDEVAARTLGMSVRHLRRHISRILADLQVENRFSAGAEAARRGWV